MTAEPQPDNRLRRRHGGHRPPDAPRIEGNGIGRIPLLVERPRALEDFLVAIRAGNNRTVSAKFAGLDPETVRHWYSRGRAFKAKQDRPYHDFYLMCEQAHASAVVMVVGNLVARSRVDHNAGLAWLRHDSPEEWGPQQLDPDETPTLVDNSKHETNVLVIEPGVAQQMLKAAIAARRGEDVQAGPPRDRLAALRVNAEDEFQDPDG